jgi:putative membrane protein
MTTFYPWVLALHIISVTAWMAGLLYLPRLFVYHTEATPHSETSETFKKMERRLLRFIMTPSMIASWLFGAALVVMYDFIQLTQGWFYAKLALVLILSAMHGYYARAVRLFAQDKNTHSRNFWRALNEIPALLLIGIVILAVVKPF